jgi:hypothetical protein
MHGAKTMIRVPLASLAVLLFCISPAKPQGIQNGGFEDFLTGWTQSVSGGGGIGVIGGGTEGHRAAKVVATSSSPQGSAVVTLSQAFSAHGGDLLQFDASSHLTPSGSGVCGVSISASGWVLDTTIPPSDWYLGHSYSLPSDATYTLTFRVETFATGSTTSRIAEMWIDNVRTTAVPEPGTLLLLGVGAALLCVAALKRQCW